MCIRDSLVGLAGTGAKSGVGMAHWEMQGWMILLLGWLFVPFYQLLNNKMVYLLERTVRQVFLTHMPG